MVSPSDPTRFVFLAPGAWASYLHGRTASWDAHINDIIGRPEDAGCLGALLSSTRLVIDSTHSFFDFDFNKDHQSPGAFTTLSSLVL